MDHDWLLKTDHTIKKIDPPVGGYKLEQLQEMVGGYIEIIPLPKTSTLREMCIVVNEDGMMKKLPLNDIASTILGCYILGDVLFCNSKNLMI